MDLKISYSSKGIENEDVEGLIVFLPEKSDTRAAGLSDLPENLKKIINTAVREEVFNGKTGNSQRLITGSANLTTAIDWGRKKRRTKSGDHQTRRWWSRKSACLLKVKIHRGDAQQCFEHQLK